MSGPTLLRHVATCNRFDPVRFRPFCIAGDPIGLVRPETADFLTVRKLAQPVGNGVGVPGAAFLALSRHLAEIVAALGEAGLMARQRGEMTPVMRHWGHGAIAEIDRAGLPGLGLPAYGVHVNGIVRPQSGIHLWVGRRAKDRLVAPGKLDHLVAGGIPSGFDAHATVVKEAGEEAGIDPEIAAHAKPVSAVSYRMEQTEGLRNDILFVYDLDVPQGLVPASTDGEVERFELWPVARVIETVRATDDFKFNVNLVLIDFFLRHGLLDPDREPDYAALAQGLRR